MSEPETVRHVTYGPGGHDPDAPDHNVVEEKELNVGPADELAPAPDEGTT